MSATAEKVLEIVQDLKIADELRAPNRALIQRQMNGQAPYTDAQMAENKIDVNFNTKTGTNLLAQANRQWANAFLKTPHYFGVTLEDAPVDRGMEWSQTITKEANRPLKRSREYYQQVRNTGSGVMLTGVGPKMWTPFDDDWCPYFVAIEDLLIPTDTQVTMDMSHFAVRRGMSYWDLYSKTLKKGKNVDPSWDLKVVRSMLDAIKDKSVSQQQWDWQAAPEKMAELFKQNATYWQSDAVPKIWLWDFLSRDDETGEWNLQIVPDENWTATYGTTNEPVAFVYDSKKPVADDLSKLLHVQFGDGNVKPPFYYHSVRSLAWLLFDLCQVQDIALCRFTSKVFEDAMLLLRVQDPADRAAVDKIHFGLRYGLLPEGIGFVKREERYQFDPQLSQMLMSQLRQHMGESASSYTQDIDSGTEKERTKFEVQALLAQTSALLSSLLNNAYIQAEFEYREICRRLCDPKSRNKDAKEFQKRCREKGVPDKWLDVERWEVRSESVMGGGSKQLELAAADKLMSVRQFMEPSAQNRTLHKLVLAVTDSAAEADELAPLKPTKVTDSVFDAALAWGTLMTGVPMPVKEGDSHREVIETLLRMMAMRVQQIMQSGGVGTPQDVAGLSNAANYVGQHIQLLAQDESEAQRVKAYGDVLGKLGNEVKAMAQRQQEAAAQQNGRQDPETMAKVQAIATTTQAKVQAKQVADQQKLAHKEQAFRQKQTHEVEKTRADLFVKGMEGVTEAGAEHARSAAEVRSIEKKAEAEAEAARKKAAASADKGE
jgi:hypothetical protein